MKTRGKKRSLRNALIVITVIFVAITLLIVAGITLTKHYYGDRTEMLKSDSETPLKALVVYQPSLTSASYDVALSLAKGIRASGYDVLISNPGKHLSADISNYQIIVFGSPNYGSSVAKPLIEYISQIDSFTGKKILLYSTSGAVEIMPELEKLSQLLKNTEPYAMVKFQFNEKEKNIEEAYNIGFEMAVG